MLQTPGLCFSYALHCKYRRTLRVESLLIFNVFASFFKYTVDKFNTNVINFVAGCV